jgi:succinoglycan biosynthesis protein ExoM
MSSSQAAGYCAGSEIAGLLPGSPGDAVKSPNAVFDSVTLVRRLAPELNPKPYGTVHICICICTFRRPELLKRLLKELAAQVTEGLFTQSIVVADNDRLESAKSVVSEFAATSSIPILYCVSPERSIAMTRNVAIANASGNFVAFIDDDEFPTEHWLLTLLKACVEFNIDGVLGPVKPDFPEDAPKWVVKGGFYHRPAYPTGLVIDWRKGRTGNVLLKMSLFNGEKEPFRPEFRTGEDQDFFARMIERGHTFIWCDEAVAYEVVPPIRWRRSFLLQRSLLQGSMEPGTPGFGFRDIAKSIVAVPVYAAAMPFALVLGHHWFMILLIKQFYHIGKLLALVGIHPVKAAYVTE